MIKTKTDGHGLVVQRSAAYKHFICTNDSHQGTLNMDYVVYEDGTAGFSSLRIGKSGATSTPVTIVKREDEQKGLFDIYTKSFKPGTLGQRIREGCYFINTAYEKHYIARDEAEKAVKHAITAHNWQKPMSRILEEIDG